MDNLKEFGGISCLCARTLALCECF